MLVSSEMIQNMLEKKPYLREKLYCRGFLVTDSEVNVSAYPFYGLWQISKINDFLILIHPQQSFYIFNDLCLIGHAYDPVAMEWNENNILASMDDADHFYQVLNRLTGVFTLIRITASDVELFCDASGMQTTFYGIIRGKKYISSHTALLGELLDLSIDPYVDRLIHYRFFHLFGNALPGDLTQFTDVKRATPNFAVILSENSAKLKRFYTPHTLDMGNDEITEQAGELLQRNMKLISQKWKRPAISLSGGCDSRTTLACAAGEYERFSYYSFVSSEAEAVDAAAAEQICKSIGLTHKTHYIPDLDNEVEDPEQTAMLLRWNCGKLLDSNANDIRKQAYFAKIDDFDIEVKSWASEIGRAYYSKRFYGKTDFGKIPTPRACTTLYKVFLHNRALVKQTDRIFADYLERYYSPDEYHPLPWQEQFFWEYRVPAWNGLVITGEHRYCHDITIPYNNRNLLELLLSASIEDRIRDTIYFLIRQKKDPRIDQTGISVTNLKHTDRRAKIEKLYYDLHTYTPL